MNINIRIVTLDGEFVKLKLMHEELKKIKKQRNLIIAVFAFISMTAIILMHFYSSVIWAIAALLLIHDIMFALVFDSIIFLLHFYTPVCICNFTHILFWRNLAQEINNVLTFRIFCSKLASKINNLR